MKKKFDTDAVEIPKNINSVFKILLIAKNDLK